MDKVSIERRINPRIDIDGEMTYYAGNEGGIRQGRLENLSVGGARIWIEQALPASSQLLIRIEPDDCEQVTMEFKATLLHMLPDRKKTLYGYGCSLEEVQEFIN